MEVKIVLGTLWGDEGKGNTVQWLCKKALEEGKKPCVVRFSGGPQAGHTVVHNGITHVCSSFGSGVLLGVPTIYLDSAFIDPLCMENERRILSEKGITAELRALLTTPVITPYDVMCQQDEAKIGESCGKGIYPTWRRCGRGKYKENDEGTRFKNLSCEEDIKDSLQEVYDWYEGVYHPSKKILKEWSEAALRECKQSCFIGVGLGEFDVLIFEGTQGLLLDPECGFHPYTTSTKVGLNGISKRYLEGAEVYLVSRTYLTRHGEMSPFDRKFIIARKRTLDIPENKLETNTFNEFQGEFKVAPMDCLPVEVAVHRHHLDNYQKKYRMKFNLAVTHMDVPDLYPSMSTKEVTSALSETLTGAGLKLSNVYGAYGPDSNFKLIRSYDN